MSDPLPPSPVILPGLEGLKEANPELYLILSVLQGAFNAGAEYAQSQAASTVRPAGPQNVAVAQLGSTIQVTWGNDESGPGISNYRILRAQAGTRLAPTVPVLTTAVQVKVVPAQNITCLPIGSINQWTDRDFPVPAFDPANPYRYTYWVQSIGEDQAQVSEPVLASGSPIELVTNGPGEQSPEAKNGPLNRLFNASLVNSLVTTANVSMRLSRVISAATNASPIAITTTTNHGLTTGDRVMIFLGAGNSAVNGYWTVVVTGAATATLTGSAGNGVYSANTGLLFDHTGQPTPIGDRDAQGNYGWSGWVGGNATASQQQWVGDAVTGLAKNEILLVSPGAAGDGGQAQQGLVGFNLRVGQHYTLSVFAKVPSSSTVNQLALEFIDASPGPTTYTQAFSASLLTTSYQRFVWNLALADQQVARTANVRFINRQTGAGAGVNITITQPQLVVGDIPGLWTGMLDTSAVPGSYTASNDPSTPGFGRAVASVVARDGTVTYT